MTDIEIIEAVPDVATYRALRREAGMTDRDAASATAGLAGTLYAVLARHESSIVGMARVIGDGGCFFVICDVAVRPAYQRRGIGDRLMQTITTWLDVHVSESAYVSLMADGDSHRLYARHGFEFTAPKSHGMHYPRAYRARSR